MTEHTFYSPGNGWWVAIDDVPTEILKGYPEGTVEIEHRPGPGYDFDGTKWVPVEPPVAVLLGNLTARQLRLGLLRIGIKPDDVTTAISGLPDGQREEALIEWQYASEFERYHPLITILAAHFGLSNDAVDAAWRASMAL